jgi:hypothetical protein
MIVECCELILLQDVGAQASEQSRLYDKQAAKPLQHSAFDLAMNLLVYSGPKCAGPPQVKTLVTLADAFITLWLHWRLHCPPFNGCAPRRLCPQAYAARTSSSFGRDCVFLREGYQSERRISESGNEAHVCRLTGALSGSLFLQIVEEAAANGALDTHGKRGKQQPPIFLSASSAECTRVRFSSTADGSKDAIVIRWCIKWRRLSR